MAVLLGQPETITSGNLLEMQIIPGGPASPLGGFDAHYSLEKLSPRGKEVHELLQLFNDSSASGRHTNIFPINQT